MKLPDRSLLFNKPRQLVFLLTIGASSGVSHSLGPVMKMR